jgi:hypothetical protein
MEGNKAHPSVFIVREVAAVVFRVRAPQPKQLALVAEVLKP